MICMFTRRLEARSPYTVLKNLSLSILLELESCLLPGCFLPSVRNQQLALERERRRRLVDREFFGLALSFKEWSGELGNF